ncbi:MAG TPA: DUF3261 domain-containing protein [Magnetospirillum sp.]|nr:DUF3261 domain-containing protein [Magnetospirillum sp.]
MTTKLHRVFSAALMAAALCACVATPPPPDPDHVPVAPGITLRLPAPADLGREVEAVQMVTARRNGETHVFEARLSVDKERLLMVGTDSLGRRAMTVTWRAGKVDAERAAWLPDGLRPENILADIVLLYWPEATLQRAVSGAKVAQNGDTRTIGDAVAVSWRGDPWNGQSRLVNSPWGYELEVRSVVVGP